MAFHTGTRMDDNFYTTDLLTDLLAGGRSARLKERLVKKRKIFSEINAWISGSIDKGFLAVTGKLMKGQKMEIAREVIWEELLQMQNRPVSEVELQKVKNKLEAAHTFAEVGILSKSINLAYYELLGDANMLNHHTENYFKLTLNDISQAAKDIFKQEKASELHYLAKK
jgi:zinc protease